MNNVFIWADQDEFKEKRYLGKLAFIYKSLTHFIFLKSNQMMVTSNNETIDANWVLSTNAKYYGGKYSITSKTGLFEKGLINQKEI